MQHNIDMLFDDMAKPLNSLGVLEKYGKKVLKILNTTDTNLKPYHLIFAADNGIVEEGVVGYPKEITYIQANNMIQGKATISSFCKYNNVPYEVIDIGIDNDQIFNTPNLKVRKGTRNFLKESAMTSDEVYEALLIGRRKVKQLVQKGYNLISFGEMGIGNTTTSSAILHILSDYPIELVTGYGAMKDDNILKRKIEVIKEAKLKYNLNTESDLYEVLGCVGGLDIAGMVGGMLQCVNEQVPFVLDGFITAVAYYFAYRIDPSVLDYVIPSHMSREPGMQLALKDSGIDPIDVPLGLNLALGEGTGAILMVGLLNTTLYAASNVVRLSELLKSM